MDEKKELLVIDSIIVQNLIYTIRGRQVMLDSDLAELFLSIAFAAFASGGFQHISCVDFNDKPSSIRYNTNQSVLFYSLQNERDIFQWMRMSALQAV